MAPTISVSPTTVMQGTNVHVTGSGFTPNASNAKAVIALTSGEYFSIPETVTATGTVDFQLQIGDNVPVGTVFISVVDAQDKPSNAVPIQVTVATTPSDIDTPHFHIHFLGPISDGAGSFDFAGWLETCHLQISTLLGLSLDNTVREHDPRSQSILAPVLPARDNSGVELLTPKSHSARVIGT